MFFNKLNFLIITAFLALATPSNLYAQQKDKIEGEWLNAEKTAKVAIHKAIDNKFWGKVVWLKEPNKNGLPKTDDKNPKAERRNLPLMGLPLLKSFVKKSENKYENGTIYDPKNGKTYSCIITYNNDHELDIHGYVLGLTFLGRSTTWTR